MNPIQALAQLSVKIALVLATYEDTENDAKRIEDFTATITRNLADIRTYFRSHQI